LCFFDVHFSFPPPLFDLDPDRQFLEQPLFFRSGRIFCASATICLPNWYPLLSQSSLHGQQPWIFLGKASLILVSPSFRDFLSTLYMASALFTLGYPNPLFLLQPSAFTLLRPPPLSFSSVSAFCSQRRFSGCLPPHRLIAAAFLMGGFFFPCCVGFLALFFFFFFFFFFLASRDKISTYINRFRVSKPNSLPNTPPPRLRKPLPL